MRHNDRYKSPNKGKPNARILQVVTTEVEGRVYEHELHSTKGWRKRRKY